MRKAFGTNVDVQFSGSHYLNQTYQQASEFRKYMRVAQQTVHQTDWIKLGAASCGAAVGVYKIIAGFDSYLPGVAGSSSDVDVIDPADLTYMTSN